MTKKRERIYLLVAYTVAVLSIIFIGDLSIANSVAACLFAAGLGVMAKIILKI